jgi:hypothetical protein
VPNQEGNFRLAEFWPILVGSSAPRDPEHRIIFDDLMSAFEHEFYPPHRRSKVDRITGQTGKAVEDERVAVGLVVVMNLRIQRCSLFRGVGQPQAKNC